MNRSHLRLIPPLLLAALLVLLLPGLAAAGGPGVAVAPRLDPLAPVNITFDSDVLSVAVQGDYAYVGLESGLVILDITNPLQPVRRGFLDTNAGLPPHFNGSPCCLQIEGDLLVISNNTYIATVDVSDPDHPVLLSPYQQYTTYAVPFKLLNRYLYIVETGKFHIFDLHDPTHPQEVYKLDDEHLIGDMESIDAEVHPLDGRTYVYMTGEPWCNPGGCIGSSFLVMDVTDPINPVIVNHTDPVIGSNQIRVEGSYGYMTNYSSYVTVIDISDAKSIQQVSQYKEEGVIFNRIEASNNRLVAGAQYDRIYRFDTTNKAQLQKISVHGNIKGYPLDLEEGEDCVYIAEKEWGLHIICEAQAHPQPPALVWLPLLRSLSGQ